MNVCTPRSRPLSLFVYVYDGLPRFPDQEIVFACTPFGIDVVYYADYGRLAFWELVLGKHGRGERRGKRYHYENDIPSKKIEMRKRSGDISGIGVAFALGERCFSTGVVLSHVRLFGEMSAEPPSTIRLFTTLTTSRYPPTSRYRPYARPLLHSERMRSYIAPFS